MERKVHEHEGKRILFSRLVQELEAVFTTSRRDTLLCTS